MKAGDLVKVWDKTARRWNSKYVGDGVLIRRTYLAYEPGRCMWEVLINGQLKPYHQRQLRVRPAQ